LLGSWVRLRSAVGPYVGYKQPLMQGISHVHVQESEVGELYPSPKEVKMHDLPGPGGRTFRTQYHDYSESRCAAVQLGEESPVREAQTSHQARMEQGPRDASGYQEAPHTDLCQPVKGTTAGWRHLPFTVCHCVPCSRYHIKEGHDKSDEGPGHGVWRSDDHQWHHR